MLVLVLKKTLGRHRFILVISTMGLCYQLIACQSLRSLNLLWIISTPPAVDVDHMYVIKLLFFIYSMALCRSFKLNVV